MAILEFPNAQPGPWVITTQSTDTTTALAIANGGTGPALTINGTTIFDATGNFKGSISDANPATVSVNSASPALTLANAGAGANISAASGAFVVSASGSLNIGSGNFVVTSGGFVSAFQQAAGSSLVLDHGSATASANAGTINHGYGEYTTASLSTAAGAATATQTITDTAVGTGNKIFFNVIAGTATAGVMFPTLASVSAGSFTFTLVNLGAAAANGTYIVQYIVV